MKTAFPVYYHAVFKARFAEIGVSLAENAFGVRAITIILILLARMELAVSVLLPVLGQWRSVDHRYLFC